MVRTCKEDGDWESDKEVDGGVYIPSNAWLLDKTLGVTSRMHRDKPRQLTSYGMKIQPTSAESYASFTKCGKLWPQLLKLYNPKQVYNWLAEFQLRVNKGALVRQYVASMSSKMYHLEEIQDSSLAEMEAMMNDHERSYHFIMDELINKGNPLRNSDLTEVYYAEKLVCCLKKQQLKKFWNNFKQVPPEEQLLEKGAVFVAKWIQSSMAVSPVLVSRQLDLLAEAVREVLRSRHPFHSIFSTPLDLVEQWKQKALTDNQFGPSECQQVLVALGEVIFNHSGFYTDNNMHYNVDNACINMVLDRCQGSPIIICIIYESVARRLGVKCDTLSLPEHFLLRWKESYMYVNG
uniref:Protein SirB1 N-terminal domain-containing protein n=1 Tax=Timema tahoe TaxID=61484 RepID=A0A7R9FG99_9NEOP|nr:unnamed protein product [Timema tahoe]